MQVHLKYSRSLKIMVNGDWIAITYDPSKLVNNLKRYRRIGIINPYVSIVWDISIQEVQVWTDSGRLTRPLLIVDDNKLRIKGSDISKIRQNKWTWNNLVVKGIKEKYINSQHDKFKCE